MWSSIHCNEDEGAKALEKQECRVRAENKTMSEVVTLLTGSLSCVAKSEYSVK